MSNVIPVVFHNDSNHDYHFIIKELESKPEEKFEYIGGNTEKYKKFSIPLEKKVIRIDKGGNKSVVTALCKIKLTDSPRFIATSTKPSW